MCRKMERKLRLQLHQKAFIVWHSGQQQPFKANFRNVARDQYRLNCRAEITCAKKKRRPRIPKVMHRICTDRAAVASKQQKEHWHQTRKQSPTKQRWRRRRRTRRGTDMGRSQRRTTKAAADDDFLRSARC